MNSSELQNYVLPILLFGFFGWKFLRSSLARRQLPALLSQGAVIVDVRSRAEFLSGARDGSINIPLDHLEKESEKLDPKKPIVLCCASGTRSSMAASILKKKGFKNILNAGAWRNTVL